MSKVARPATSTELAGRLQKEAARIGETSLAIDHPLLRLAAERLIELERERDLAIAHDRQPYPTVDAHGKVCTARDKWQARASQLEADCDGLVYRLGEVRDAQLRLEDELRERTRQALVQRERAELAERSFAKVTALILTPGDQNRLGEIAGAIEQDPLINADVRALADAFFLRELAGRGGEQGNGRAGT